MFNDERERVLFEEHEDSIQAWGKRLENGSRNHQSSLRGRLLLATGKTMIHIGASLTRRFGSTPRDQVYS